MKVEGSINVSRNIGTKTKQESVMKVQERLESLARKMVLGQTRHGHQ